MCEIYIFVAIGNVALYNCAPPIMNASFLYVLAFSIASSNDVQTSMPLVFDIVVLTTILFLLGNGLNLLGMEKYVFFPIITVLSVVCSLKSFISSGMFQGIFPFIPMTLSLVIATIMLMFIFLHF